MKDFTKGLIVGFIMGAGGVVLASVVNSEDVESKEIQLDKESLDTIREDVKKYVTETRDKLKGKVPRPGDIIEVKIKSKGKIPRTPGRRHIK